ncbi:MAG: 2-oxoglutarate dehydrogenase E1 component [Sumerlaeia bacterium]
MQETEQQGWTGSVNGWNSDYVDHLYRQWLDDPSSVDQSWHPFFQGFDLGQTRLEEEGASAAAATVTAAASPAAAPLGDSALERLQSRVDSLIYHYRDLGHLIARIDPLGRINSETHPLLDLENFDLGPEHLDMEFHADKLLFGPARMTLRAIIDSLKTIYCQTIGVEYMHIQNTPERRWLQKRMEPFLNKTDAAPGKKLRVARCLRQAEAFEKFLHTTYVGQKRFSLEGGETLIPTLDTIVEKAGLEGIEEIVLGMAHRGRLNVLANILQKSHEEIFSDFEDNYSEGQVFGDGDVKYHKGYSTDWTTYHGQDVHLSLTANPSHLEAVNPVVQGRVRGKQRRLNDMERVRVMPLLIHGDAAFAGQGIVAEILNYSQLKGYATGGTIHVIVNNQIGFTTSPEEGRSTRYPTDVAKMVQAPIFHVNADDPDAVLQAAEIAVEFRQRFHKDVVIDLVCYRRLGHNEGDEPGFTQPQMYQAIKNHPSTYEIYKKTLIEEEVVPMDRLEAMEKELDSELAAAHERAKDAKIQTALRAFSGDTWRMFKRGYTFDPVDTRVSREDLIAVAKIWHEFPEGFHVHKKLSDPKKRRGVFDKRWEGVSTEGGTIDWATGEGLAIGSLLLENIPVRISGQDSRRGTFSQRHAMIWDTKSAEGYMPLNNVRPGKQARFCCYDSPLSEASVLGFDYGYSLDNPDMLICWEAQFGDFVNGAQVIIDQFIISGESKWGRGSGLVLLLPHGYEGQGPEHSNAWLDRFLSLCADENIQVCNATTPAQYFHLLRRQMKRDFRKPLILMSPKSLLRHPRAVSTVDDLVNGTFQEIKDDPTGKKPGAVRRVVLCGGKVYYDLAAYREEQGVDDVALVRVEQFYPYHKKLMAGIVGPYLEKGADLVWCQEEPLNRGAWRFIEPLLREQFGHVTYVGRNVAASPSVGSLNRHNAEQARILAEAFSARAEDSDSPRSESIVSKLP